MSKDMFLRSILPIGLLFSASLILSNTAYLYLSVAYIQMLKAFVPVAILLISWTFRIQDPSKRLAVIVLMISSGVALASRGELRFNLIGFIVQAAAVVVSLFVSTLPLPPSQLCAVTSRHDESCERALTIFYYLLSILFLHSGTVRGVAAGDD